MKKLISIQVRALDKSDLKYMVIGFGFIMNFNSRTEYLDWLDRVIK